MDVVTLYNYKNYTIEHAAMHISYKFGDIILLIQ